jgi:hypothetical protein
MDPDQAQRALDFVAGGTCNRSMVIKNVLVRKYLLFTPSCVQVSTQAGAAVNETVQPIRYATRPTVTTSPSTAECAYGAVIVISVAVLSGVVNPGLLVHFLSTYLLGHSGRNKFDYSIPE